MGTPTVEGNGRGEFSVGVLDAIHAITHLAKTEMTMRQKWTQLKFLCQHFGLIITGDGAIHIWRTISNSEPDSCS